MAGPDDRSVLERPIISSPKSSEAIGEGTWSDDSCCDQVKDGRSTGPDSKCRKASEEDTAGRFSFLADEPPQFGPPMHIHHNCAEAFYALAGEYVSFIEEQEFRGPAGLVLLRSVQYTPRLSGGTEPSRKLNLYVPGAMVEHPDLIRWSRELLHEGPHQSSLR